MTPKTEAERRYEAFMKSAGLKALAGHLDARALFRAIFDPLPPEPSPEKSPGQILWEAEYSTIQWSTVATDAQERFEGYAGTLIAAHEARRPKPTVEEVAKVLCETPPNAEAWSSLPARMKDMWMSVARAVFPLFGVEP